MNDLSQEIFEVAKSVVSTVENSVKKLNFSKFNLPALSNDIAIEIISQEIENDIKNIIKNSREQLNTPKQGISIIDIPSPENDNPVFNIWIGALIALIITKQLYPTRLDKNTGLPFTLYNASAEGQKLLDKNGIKYYSPEQILGFHTDGIVLEDALWSPKFVSIYNMHLAYKKPGNFHWIPFALWNEFSEWNDRLSKKRFKLGITPITYKTAANDLVITSNGEFDVALMIQTEGATIPFFNGEVSSCISDPLFNINHIKHMHESLSKNSTRISAPIKARRLFIVNNWLGAHARDIFEEPLTGVKYSRSFFRAMSSEIICA